MYEVATKTCHPTGAPLTVPFDRPTSEVLIAGDNVALLCLEEAGEASPGQEFMFDFRLGSLDLQEPWWVLKRLTVRALSSPVTVSVLAVCQQRR